MKRYNFKKNILIKKFLIFFVILIFNVFCLNLFANPTESELKNIKENIRNKKEELNKTKKQAELIKKEVLNLGYFLNKTRKNIKKIEKDIDLQQNDYQKYTLKLNTEKQRERYYKKVLSREIEFLYKQKYINNNEFLKTLNSFFLDADFGKNVQEAKILETFLMYNRNKVYYIKDIQHSIQKTQNKIEETISELNKNKEKNKETQNKYSIEQQTKQKVLKEVVLTQKQYEKQIKDLEVAARQMEKLLKELARKSSLANKAKVSNTNRKVESMKLSNLVRELGYISMPVSGNIIVKYGKNKHEKYDTYHLSNGIEIETSGSVGAKAVYPGKVVFCDRFSSYGNTVIIEHPKQVYTVYAYLDKITVSKDQNVNKGTVLGMTGVSAVKNVNALYFEVRLNGIAVDPEDWIK
jgi:murein hydrolase activator